MNRTILRLVAGRIAVGLLSLLAVSIVVFAITSVLPGDAAQEKLGQDATPEALAALRKEMGLDRPAPERYVQWLGGIVRGDPGISPVTGGSVGEMISSRLPASYGPIASMGATKTKPKVSVRTQNAPLVT